MSRASASPMPARAMRGPMARPVRCVRVGRVACAAVRSSSCGMSHVRRGDESIRVLVQASAAMRSRAHAASMAALHRSTRARRRVRRVEHRTPRCDAGTHVRVRRPGVRRVRRANRCALTRMVSAPPNSPRRRHGARRRGRWCRTNPPRRTPLVAAKPVRTAMQAAPHGASASPRGRRNRCVRASDEDARRVFIPSWSAKPMRTSVVEHVRVRGVARLRILLEQERRRELPDAVLERPGGAREGLALHRDRRVADAW